MLKSRLMEQEVFKTAQRAHGVLTARGLSLSVAESCTGGFLSGCLTALPGASAFFVLGVVAYSRGAKEDVLNISKDTLLSHGMVSEATAREMALRVRAMGRTDFSLSTTGNLGPEALEGKEEGLVYIAACGRRGTVSRELRLKGGREANREEAARWALELLLELMEADDGSS